LYFIVENFTRKRGDGGIFIDGKCAIANYFEKWRKVTRLRKEPV